MLKTRGINHIDLGTKDMEATRAFYEDVLGFPLVRADLVEIGDTGRMKHFFFDAGNGQLIGYWETRSGTYVLRGKVGYDQNSWSGAFAKPNDHSDFPIKGQFQLMMRDGGQITGSYQPTRTASSFPVTGTR